MKQQLTLITLGVHDLARAKAFYEALGWTCSSASQEQIIFFQLNNGVGLALYPWELLAEDVTIPAAGEGFRGVTLAYNGVDKAEVDQVLATAAAAGATIVKPAQDVFWGGYSGYFRDPEGHLFEVAYNPHLIPDANGQVRFP
ncbi:VOC family protein [Chitinophaga pendula]|uniref:VOC family protein n=1 Tax=Chitinophaga TaxID=79328 RepID=UPI000BB06964|nr:MULTISPECIES: VOC family protein [Chitinophaga]ASZ10460.1 glyoxalase [Chitinophaga sp. MD30]UCJ06569.1 VOC family protein [Chitinophaga pendula]